MTKKGKFLQLKYKVVLIQGLFFFSISFALEIPTKGNTSPGLPLRYLTINHKKFIRITNKKLTLCYTHITTSLEAFEFKV